ncbi:TetR/AcrR family transcriptional regulator [Cupriavidus sp. WS]|uniref:TetR/AcrR family transcriptional regulator n=1 Tax=Cupriavidus sp. WS TaxID=1312922 RepID=UPI0007C7CD93|nr:TetR/AcrR family transcriptional regulator [Cupriavidus sp. WS]
MPRPPLLKEAAHSHLVRAGLRAFMKDGFNGTGVRDIVQAAKVPNGSFYYYFESKEALAAAVVDLYSELTARKRTELLVGDRSLPPLVRVRNYLEQYVEYSGIAGFRQGCLLGALTLEIGNASPAVRERIREAFRKWEAMLLEVFEEAEARGDLPAGLGAAQAAAFTLNGWEGALVRMKAERSVEPLRLFVDTLFKVVLRVPEDAPGGRAAR